MNTTDQVHYFTAEAPPRHNPNRPALAPSRHELASPVRSAIVRARQLLIGRQRLDGSWAGRRTGDVSSLPQLLLLDAYLLRERGEFAEQAVRTLLVEQLPTGGWSSHHDGLFDLDQSVLTYFALKLCGESATQPDMVRARGAILEQGGADACSARTRLWFCVLGQISYEHCAAIAPEELLTTGSGNLSAADELMLAALSAVWALRPRREIELALGVRELFIEQPQKWLKQTSYIARQSSSTFAGFWNGCERIGFVPLRRRAIDRANFLLTEAAVESIPLEVSAEHFAWQRIALEALGHTASSRVIAACQRRHEALTGTEPDEARSNPETWLTADTSAALEALAESGMGADELPMSQGIHWLAAHRFGPARKYSRAQELAEILNAFTCHHHAESVDGALPPKLQVTDGTGELAPDPHQSPLPMQELCGLLLHDCCALQLPDGGWSIAHVASGSNRGRGLLRGQFLNAGRVSEPEATGTMLELISRQPSDSDRFPVERGVAYLRDCQRGDGGWQSATGNRRIQSTSWAVRGLIAGGSEVSDPAVAAGVNWLVIHQQESGGWGETDRPTAAETALAILALVAAGLTDHDATRRGVGYLVDCQCDDGSWGDELRAACDAETGLSYRNDLLSSSAALLTLARWTVAIGSQNRADEPAQLRLVCNDVPW
jgi:squalene-hopene/tetraprenyl-beta-curcumene cyclase